MLVTFYARRDKIRYRVSSRFSPRGAEDGKKPHKDRTITWSAAAAVYLLDLITEDGDDNDRNTTFMTFLPSVDRRSPGFTTIFYAFINDSTSIAHEFSHGISGL